MRNLSYRHTAYPSAWLAAACGFLYSVTFVFIPGAGALTAALLLLGGIFGSSALIGLYERIEPGAGRYALWALIFGVAAAFSATLHGGYDLANAINPPGQTATLPSPVDPRGLGTFGLAGASVIAFAFLISREARFPRNFAYLGYVSGTLLILVYLARLVILTPSNPLVLGPAAVEGFIVNPAWYVWLGFLLRRAS